MNRTKLGILTLIGLAILVGLSRLLNSSGVLGAGTFSFQFDKARHDVNLENVVNANLRGKSGNFAVYIEELPASPSAALKNPKRYAVNESEVFPAASLYKLVLMAAVEKEIEGGRLKREDAVSSNKQHLTEVLGGVDFGYEDVSGQISYTVDEALIRVGRISDNFAAIMLTEKIRQTRLAQEGSAEGLLFQMVKELGMNHTDFTADPINTTALDIATFFKQLYLGRVVSVTASGKIKEYLSLSKINNRIPAGVPEGVKVIHKTGELARVRHDAGIVFSSGSPYIIVLLGKDLKYEDEGVETLAGISKDVYNYFSAKK